MKDKDKNTMEEGKLDIQETLSALSINIGKSSQFVLSANQFEFRETY